MNEGVVNVLFLCTGNSGRSIMAEALLNHLGQGRFRAFSAGSRPSGRVHPLAIEALAGAGVPAAGLASKGWDVFADPGAPRMDAVITLCDSAAGEACPSWPGHPARVHWGFPDPSADEGTAGERRQDFEDVFAAIESQIRRLAALEDAGGPSWAARLQDMAPAG